MGHCDDRTLVLLEVGLKPLDTLRVKVVGRLIKKQHIRLPEKQTAKSDTTAFSTAEGAYLRI